MNVHSHVRQDEFCGQSGVGDFSTGRASLSALAVGALSVGLEAFAVIALSVASGLAYHLAVYAHVGEPLDYLSVGIFIALVLNLPFIFRGDYRLPALISGTRRPRDITLAWNYAFICLVVLSFLTKTTTMYSRGWLILFYLSGVLALPRVVAFTSYAVRQAMRRGRIGRRRLMLIGEEGLMRTFLRRIAGDRSGVAVTSTIDIGRCLTGDLDLADVLADAVRIARNHAVEDVVILTDWSKVDVIDRIADRFAELPVAVQLAAPAEMARFRQSRLTHYGRAPTFALSSPPLLPYQLLCKRGFDALVSAMALLLLAPVFAAIAVAIKLDSEGPVFFRQRRRGYNQREFLIWKFRTMTVMDDGDTIVQAQRNDGRVTRVGRYLRSLNLDELPQLINVIAGDMSLVGPRPHAVAHDRHFEPRIRRYARRLNVKPGITGWAQVNGYRGLTETENDMKNRIVHDLYYIENWSIAFDVYILIRTVLSPRAYRNAF
jgi:Undecaprenyl-phosphate glucose phosphotransferase